MNDVAGRNTALTLITPFRPFGATWLRILLWGARHFDFVKAPAIRMSFIHFCHWIVLDRVPTGGEQPRWRRLRPAYLVFSSNFDGSAAGYIDSFIHAMPWRMRGLWGSARGNPGILPSSGFTDWTERNAIPASHYYCAYPEATTSMVSAGLAIQASVEPFLAAAPGMTDDEFAAAWAELLTDVQTCL